MKSLNPSEIEKYLSLLALRRETQNDIHPTAQTLQEDIDELSSLLHFLYPEVSLPEGSTNSLLVLQRFLFAGALRAREFMQVQQAIFFLQQEPHGEGAAAHAQLLRMILRSFIPKECCFLGGPAVEAFLSSLQQSPDPERSLLWALSLLERPFGHLYFRFFCKHEPLLKGIVKLSALSESFSRFLLQNLDLPEAGSIKKEPESIHELRSWQQQELFGVVLAKLSGTISIYEAQEEFSRLAEVCVAYCLQRALCEDAQENKGETPRMAIIALGSLGGHELLYQSDLDLLFLSDGDERFEERCTRAAQRTIELLSAKSDEGSLYEVDTRLRPSGSQGPLVVSIQSFGRYFGLIESDGPRAHLWEEQALLRARPLCGEATLLSAFAEHRRRILQRPRAKREVAYELRQMRQKIESEVPKRRKFYYKASSGGLQDIDFIAQFLQLTHGDKEPRLLCPTTHQSLTIASEAGLLPIQDSQGLRAAQKQWLNLVLTTRLLFEKSLDFLPENSNAMRSVLRAQQLSSEEAFQKQLELLRGYVRACFDRLVH